MPAATLSLELASGALTRWQGFTPTELRAHAGGLVAADGQALYRLGGDNDNGVPIAARIVLPATDGGLTGRKRLGAVRLEGVLEGQVAVATGSDIGQRREGQAGPAGRDDLPGVALARLGRGLGRAWQVELAATDGATLDIAAIDLDFTVLDRRDG